MSIHAAAATHTHATKNLCAMTYLIVLATVQITAHL